MKAPFFIYCFRFFLSILTAAAAFVSSAHLVAAAGFGVSPSSLEFVVEKGSEASRQIIIYNTREPVEFIAVSSSPELIQVYPEAGVVAGEGTARLTVTAFGKKTGVANERIAISFRNPQINGGSEVALSLGTYVAARLSVVELAAKSANAFVGFLVSSGVFVAGLLAYLPIRKRLRQPLHM